MKESIVARQPVLNLKQKVIAYEILFKHSYNNKFIPKNIKDTAKELNEDMEFIEERNLSNGKKIFIRFTEDLLKEEIANLLSKDNLGIEISEKIKDNSKIMNVIKRLKDEGSLIILNDLDLNEEKTTLIKFADIIKIDFNKYQEEEHKIIINLIKNKYDKDLKFLAENIDEHKQFKKAKECGYDYFKGIFFTKPDIIAHREMPGYKLNYFNFLKELNKENLNFNRLENIIKNDMSMTVSLLGTINSAYYGYNISSIKQASTLLGINGLKKWSLIYLAEGLRNDKPDILFVNTLTRAKFAESLASDFDIENKSGELFTMGMFSMLDAFLNRSFKDILDEISVSDQIKNALLKREKIFGEILDLVIAFERVKWEQISVIEKRYNLKSKQIYNKYLTAVDFAYETMNILMQNSY